MIPLDLQEARWTISEGLADMYKRLITADPRIMMGKPVIAGTRITVEHILEELAAGSTVEELLDAHPRLTREDVQAALAYAVELLRTAKAAS
jgi:uncharacterized protein (DUF433 family)